MKQLCLEEQIVHHIYHLGAHLRAFHAHFYNKARVSDYSLRID